LKKTRFWTSTIAAAATLAAGMVFASPASAAAFTVNLGTVCGSLLPITSLDVAEGDTVTITNSSAQGAAAMTLTASSGIDPAGDRTLGTTAPNNTLTWTIAAGFSSGSITISSHPGGAGCGQTLTLTTGGGGGGGGGDSSGGAAVAPAPVEVSLALDLAASGATCAEGSAATGVMGAWMTLPGADDCSSPTIPDARLLGWSTTADFPVEIAQRQIDNGWGAYEMFDDEGRLTAVFIPAGQATFVSASTSLHPLWAN